MLFNRLPSTAIVDVEDSPHDGKLKEECRNRNFQIVEDLPAS